MKNTVKIFGILAALCVGQISAWCWKPQKVWEPTLTPVQRLGKGITEYYFHPYKLLEFVEDGQKEHPKLYLPRVRHVAQRYIHCSRVLSPEDKVFREILCNELIEWKHHGTDVQKKVADDILFWKGSDESGESQ